MTGNERGTNVQLFDRLDDTVHHALPEHERMVLDAVRQLAREKIAPRAAALDAAHRFPRDNTAHLNALAPNPSFFPEAHGGCGLYFAGDIAFVQGHAKSLRATQTA